MLMNEPKKSFLRGVATGVQTLVFSNENYNFLMINEAHVKADKPTLNSKQFCCTSTNFSFISNGYLLKDPCLGGAVVEHRSICHCQQNRSNYIVSFAEIVPNQ
jgi:hypothetical protein